MSGPPAEASSSICISAPAEEISEWLASTFNSDIDYRTDKKQKIIQEVFSKRSEDADEYEPRIVSIGPIHKGKPHLQHMEDLKQSLARKDVEESRFITPSFVEVMLRARNCYPADHAGRYDDRGWCMMMFLDTLFIHSFIQEHVPWMSGRLRDMKNHEVDLVHRDLKLLENQLPFEVLKVFMKTKTTATHHEITLLNFLKQQVDYVLPSSAGFLFKLHIPDETLQPVSDENLLQLFREIWINGDNHINKAALSPKFGEIFKHDHAYPFLSVTGLKKMGIHCTPGNYRGRYYFSPLNIWFIPSALSGELFLPPLAIREWTKSMLLNLIAYERSSDESSVISSYLNFMAMLIVQEEDVKELLARGVISNFIGSDQAVVDLFKVTKANLLSHDPRSFEGVKSQIAVYLSSKRHPLRIVLAEFKQRYFGGPWSFLVFVAVIFTVAMTILQTVFTGIQTFQKGKL